MPTLTTVQKAPLLDETGTQILGTAATVTSANPLVATTVVSNSRWWVSAGTPGTTTITATRVTAPAVPFSISLGAPVPK